MMDYYVAGVIVVAIVLFAVGLGLMIHGYRKYDFTPLVFIAPFAGVAISFPIYYALRERSLKKNDTPIDKVEHIHRLTVLGWWFFGAIIIIPAVMSIIAFVGVFDTAQAGGDMALALKATWPKYLFWSIAAVCAAYAVVLPIVGHCRKK